MSCGYTSHVGSGHILEVPVFWQFHFSFYLSNVQISGLSKSPSASNTRPKGVVQEDTGKKSSEKEELQDGVGSWGMDVPGQGVFWWQNLQPRDRTLQSLLLLSRFSHVRLCATPKTAHQAPRSVGFSRQEHWSGLPFPSPMHQSEKWKWSHSVVSDS